MFKSSGLAEQYNHLVVQGVLQHDAHQQNAMEALDQLLQQMVEYEKDMRLYHAKLNDWEQSRRQLREQLLREDAEKEVQRQLEKKKSKQGKGSFVKWFARWHKQLQQWLLEDGAKSEKQWLRQNIWEVEGNLLRKSKRSNDAEPGTGRMVAQFNREKKLDLLVGPQPALPSGPKGLYIYGSVGCGKTMLMDMFYNVADRVVKHRRRLHFHEAMLEIHELMHKLWKQQLEKMARDDVSESTFDETESTEPESVAVEKAIKRWLDAERKFEEDHSRTTLFDLVAEKLLGNEAGVACGGATLLCFDEMQVVDVFTAVALAGIFSRLIKKGTVIIVTSNRAPGDLNKDGMQKEIFDNFIAELQDHCHTILVGTEKDYRRELAHGAFEKNEWPNYFWPLNHQAEIRLEQKWQNFLLQAGGKVESVIVPVMFGRKFEVPQSCNGVARFSFEQICDRPVGAADYISIARNFHTVFITCIPTMSMRNRDKARRFITLIDELYNHRRQMICTAETPIDELFLGSEEGSLIDFESLQFETEAESSRLRRNVLSPGSVAAIGTSREERASIQSLLSGREELFAFQRAVSRLIEMQTPVYLQAMNFHIQHKKLVEVCD